MHDIGGVDDDTRPLVETALDHCLLAVARADPDTRGPRPPVCDHEDRPAIRAMEQRCAGYAQHAFAPRDLDVGIDPVAVAEPLQFLRGCREVDHDVDPLFLDPQCRDLGECRGLDDPDQSRKPLARRARVEGHRRAHADRFGVGREHVDDCLQRLGTLGAETWFRIGDVDLATHLLRTDRMRNGCTLSGVTAEICSRYGIRCRILPMTDSPVPTLVHTDEGVLAFQDYFVRRKCAPRVSGFTFQGADQARPAPGVLEALSSADGIVVCPSNPFISIGPILAVPGVRDAICQSPAKVVAVSPVIQGQAVKGPTAAMLHQLGHEVSAAGVAAIYADMLDVYILDRRDEALRSRVSGLGFLAVTAETLMDSVPDRKELARAVLEALR